MPDGEEVARDRANSILAILELSSATDFLARLDGPSVEVRPNRNGWSIDLRFLFRDPDGGRILKSPTVRGANEPILMIEERLSTAGLLTGPNYEIAFPEWDTHFGFHYHGHGGVPYPHTQGHGVPGGHQQQREQVDLVRDEIFWKLLSQAYVIDGSRTS